MTNVDWRTYKCTFFIFINSTTQQTWCDDRFVNLLFLRLREDICQFFFNRGGYHETQRNQRYHPYQHRSHSSISIGNSSQEKSTAPICYHCRKRGHVARNCWFKEEKSDNQDLKNSSKDHSEFSAFDQ